MTGWSAEAVSAYASRRTELSRVDTTVIELIAEEGPGIRILEVGCGNGVVVDGVLERCGGALESGTVLTDASIGFLPLARRRLGAAGAGTPFLCACDAALLPLTGGSFDLVLAMAVLHHLDGLDFRRALFEIARVSVPGAGLLVVEDWAFSDPEPFEREAMCFRFGAPCRPGAAAGGEHHWSSDEWGRLCSGAGYALESETWVPRRFDPAQRNLAGERGEVLRARMRDFPERERTVRMWLGHFRLKGVHRD